MRDQRQPPDCCLYPTLAAWMHSLAPVERLAEFDANLAGLEVLKNPRKIAR